MAKTYTAPTTVSAGDAITASLYNTYVGTNVANLIVPPAVQVVRTTNLTSYTSNTLISFSTTPTFDTDGMFSAASPTFVTIQTPGIYLISFVGQLQCTATLTLALATIYKNGVSTRILLDTPAVQATEALFATSLITPLVATDQIGAGLTTGGGSSYIITGNATEQFNQTRLTLTWLGRTS